MCNTRGDNLALLHVRVVTIKSRLVAAWVFKTVRRGSQRGACTDRPSLWEDKFSAEFDNWPNSWITIHIEKLKDLQILIFFFHIYYCIWMFIAVLKTAYPIFLFLVNWIQHTSSCTVPLTSILIISFSLHRGTSASYLPTKLFFHVSSLSCVLQAPSVSLPSSLLTFQNLRFSLCTKRFNIPKFCVLPAQCIYVLYLDLSDYFSLQH